MTLGEYLKNQRELMNYSTRDITKLTKISGAYISQIETGKRKPSANVLNKLAKIYMVPSTHLLELAGYVDKEPGEWDSTTTIESIKNISYGIQDIIDNLESKKECNKEREMCERCKSYIEYEIEKYTKQITN